MYTISSFKLSPDAGAGASAAAGAAGAGTPAAAAAAQSSSPAGSPSASPPAGASGGASEASPAGGSTGGGASVTSTLPAASVGGATPQQPAALPPAQAAAAMHSLFTQVQDPVPPKDWSPEGYAAYQQKLAQAQSLRDFQRSVLDVVQRPVSFGDGVSMAFTSQEDVAGFGQFISQVANGQRPLTGRDMLALYKLESLLSMAREHGGRSFEAGVRARGAAAPAPSAPTTPKTESNAAALAEPGRVPSVGEILKARNPEYFNKLMKGEISLA